MLLSQRTEATTLPTGAPPSPKRRSCSIPNLSDGLLYWDVANVMVLPVSQVGMMSTNDQTNVHEEMKDMTRKG